MEVETKFKTDDLEGLKKKLLKMGAKFSSPVNQVDEYYKTKGKELETQKPGSVLIRIRSEDKKYFLTSKELTERTGAWIEYEVEISGKKDMEKILEQLNMIKVFSITKTRVPGKLGYFGICLDSIKELGNYLEVEVMSDDSEGAKGKIKGLMEELDIDEKNVEHRGYAAILFQRMGVKYEGTGG